MRVVKSDVELAAYCVFDWASIRPYFAGVDMFGFCYDCNDEMVGKAMYKYGIVILDGASVKDGVNLAKTLSPFDMRTLKMVKSGCCPPGLVNEILESGPD